MGTLPSTERGRLTRQRIVSAAAEVVAEKGAAGASLDEVGARAPASRSQLYHYFDDKDDLLRAVAEVTNDTVLDAQQDLFAGLGTWDGLVRWTDALVGLQQERGGRGGCPIANLLGQLGERDEEIRVVLASGFDRWQASIRARPGGHGRIGRAPTRYRRRLAGRIDVWPVCKAASFSPRPAATPGRFAVPLTEPLPSSGRTRWQRSKTPHLRVAHVAAYFEMAFVSYG